MQSQSIASCMNTDWVFFVQVLLANNQCEKPSLAGYLGDLWLVAIMVVAAKGCQRTQTPGMFMSTPWPGGR